MSSGYDSRKRRWRHLDTCQYKTILVADVPRVQVQCYMWAVTAKRRCSKHGTKV
uniref:transposase family protein n=1 Tax=Candidatus Vondammii sp. HM_W22 TaxID=2687299 RepID=UPI002E7B6540|nr:transposase family protein [Candidatus Vondammii sp. HM_W22]